MLLSDTCSSNELYRRLISSLFKSVALKWTRLNRLTPEPPVTCWASAFLPLLTSSLLTTIGIIYTQLVQEENIFPMMLRSGWLAEWSPRYAQKCSKSWVKNSEQNFLPFHLISIFNFDFSTCPNHNVIKRDASGKNGKLSCCKCIFDQIKAYLKPENCQNVQKTFFFCKKLWESMGWTFAFSLP